MRAAVLVDVGRLEIREIPRVEPRAHEVVVRVQAVGLCGTDLHIVSGEANYNFDERGHARPLREHPQILGHEIAGVVEEVGSDASGFAKNQRVIVDQGRTCISEHRAHVCEYCTTGDSHQCEHYREHGITDLPGAFAEYITVASRNLVRLDSDLAADQAALTEPLGCIIHSTDLVMRARSRYTLGGERPVTSVLIFGGGPAGLLFTQYLRNVVGFDGLLIVSEPNARKRELAQQFGAVTVDPLATDLGPFVQEHTKGRKAELVIDASGAGPVFTQIPLIARKQSTILMYGHGHNGVDLSAMNYVQFLEPTMLAPAGASGRHDPGAAPDTYARALKLIEDGAIDVGALISHRYSSLDAIPSAFAGDHLLPDYVKGVVVL